MVFNLRDQIRSCVLKVGVEKSIVTKVQERVDVPPPPSLHVRWVLEPSFPLIGDLVSSEVPSTKTEGNSDGAEEKEVFICKVTKTTHRRNKRTQERFTHRNIIPVHEHYIHLDNATFRKSDKKRKKKLNCEKL